jgi:hypothetical protein
MSEIGEHLRSLQGCTAVDSVEEDVEGQRRPSQTGNAEIADRVVVPTCYRFDRVIDLIGLGTEAGIEGNAPGCGVGVESSESSLDTTCWIEWVRFVEVQEAVETVIVYVRAAVQLVVVD